MPAQQSIFDRLSTSRNLPTLPHILLKLLDACCRDDVDLDEISAIVGKDPSLCVKLLKLVNSAYFGLPQKVEDIGQAVVYVGTSTIKNMAICACVYDAFPRSKKNGTFDLKAFWWHSLKCAFIARDVASGRNLCPGDEAFTSGLLHDIGKLVLWLHGAVEAGTVEPPGNDDAERLPDEEAPLGPTHGEVGAWLLDRWNFQNMAADPVRYHHEPPERIAQALPMTQVVWIANCLAQDEESRVDEGIIWAQKILNLSAEACRALIDTSLQNAREAADALGIDIPPNGQPSATIDENDRVTQDALSRDVRNLSLLMGTLDGFLTASDRHEILSVMADGLKILLDVHHFLYFILDDGKKVLYGYDRDDEGRYAKEHRLAVAMEQDATLVVKAITDKAALNSFDYAARQPLKILDEQIIGLLGGEGIYCLPLYAGGEAVGVAVLGIRNNELPHLVKNARLARVLMHKGALALKLDQVRQDRLQEIQTGRLAASSDLARRVVHEANNPLSIIKNYLKILELKLAGTDHALVEIGIINEEISRVASLLRQLTDFSTPRAPSLEPTDLNALIGDMATLARESLPRHARVTLETDLDPGLPAVRADKAGIKQVAINLIKNALEAMPSGGTIRIRTRYLPPGGVDGRPGNAGVGGTVTMTFEDDGPGIPKDLRESLFDPYVSSKTDGHSGLGLAIVHNIVKSNKGHLTCESAPGEGTVFRIDLPVR